MKPVIWFPLVLVLFLVGLYFVIPVILTMVVVAGVILVGYVVWRLRRALRENG